MWYCAAWSGLSHSSQGGNRWVRSNGGMMVSWRKRYKLRGKLLQHNIVHKNLTWSYLRLDWDESATHILCDCEAVAQIRFRHLGQFFMEQLTTMWLHKQSLTFHSRCRINKEFIQRGSTIDHWRSRCKGWILRPTPYTYIHTYIRNWRFVFRSEGITAWSVGQLLFSDN
jgi:hypothetical protein